MFKTFKSIKYQSPIYDVLRGISGTTSSTFCDNHPHAAKCAVGSDTCFRNLWYKTNRIQFGNVQKNYNMNILLLFVLSVVKAASIGADWIIPDVKNLTQIQGKNMRNL